MFDNYCLFTDCSARLSKFAAFGQLSAQIAIMVPISTVWSKTKVMDWLSGAFKEYADVLNNSCEELLRRHFEFEFIFEDAPESAAELAQFKVVVLPKAVVLPEAVAERLQQFRQHGGRVIAISEAPAIGSTAQIMPCDLVVKDYKQLIAELPEQPYKITGEGSRDIVSALRSNGNESLLLIANQTAGSKTLTLSSSFDVPVAEVLDPDQSGIYKLDDPREWQFILAENQSVIVRFAHTASAEVQPLNEFALLEKSNEKTVFEFKEPWQFDFGRLNAVPLALQLRFDPADCGVTDKWYADPPAEWYKVCNDLLPFNVRRNECGCYWVRGAFDIVSEVPENLSLILSNASADRVYLNGIECSSWSSCCLWDQNNRANYIAPAARVGRNEFFVRINITGRNDEHMKFPGTRDRVLAMVLAGNFAAVEPDKLTPPPEKISLGSWTRCGFAGLPGWGCYRTEFELDELPEHPVLIIEDAKDTLEVFLNGKALPPRAWKPFRFDLKDSLLSGRNTLEIRVSGGVGNLLWRTAYIPKAVNVDYGLTGAVKIKDLQ